MFVSTPSLHRFEAGNQSKPPQHLGTRYDRQGNFLPESGNTVVCHLTEGSPSRTAVLSARRRLMAISAPGRQAFTPSASLHMTLFGGVTETQRTAAHWPAEMPLDADIDDMTAFHLGRLRGFRGCGAFKVAVTEVTPLGLRLAGASSADEQIMRAWRDTMTVPFGLRQPDHDSYGFHMTFAYMIDWLNEEDVPIWRETLTELLAVLLRDAPVLDLDPPAFCRFADMKHFEALGLICRARYCAKPGPTFSPGALGASPKVSGTGARPTDNGYP